MTFIGRLKEHSLIWKRWRGEARTGGVIYGVHFSWEPGNVYRTMPLTPRQIAFLQAHDNVILEMVGTDLPPPSLDTAKPAEPEPPAAPVIPVVRVESHMVTPAKSPHTVNNKHPGRFPGRS